MRVLKWVKENLASNGYLEYERKMCKLKLSNRRTEAILVSDNGYRYKFIFIPYGDITNQLH